MLTVRQELDIDVGTALNNRYQLMKRTLDHKDFPRFVIHREITAPVFNTMAFMLLDDLERMGWTIIEGQNGLTLIPPSSTSPSNSFSPDYNQIQGQ